MILGVHPLSEKNSNKNKNSTVTVLLKVPVRLKDSKYIYQHHNCSKYNMYHIIIIDTLEFDH